MADATYDQWISSRPLASIGTNAGSNVLPFQSWKNFKEAFAPEVLEQVRSESRIDVKTVLDPFLGSGTSALAAQFLGIHPIGIEVNPYLAELSQAKCATYDPDALIADYERVLASAKGIPDVDIELGRLPPSFVQPGIRGRYLYSRQLAERTVALNLAIRNIANETNQRLLRVLLGGVLIEASNIRVSGKGRRYRAGWQTSEKGRSDIAALFARNFQTALGDILRFGKRACLSYDIINGDSRSFSALQDKGWDASVFSPPYPNSFDYTDVYNVELWMLGYLRDASGNTRLRNETLTSHVQIKRPFGKAPEGSPTLDRTLAQLRDIRPTLWNRYIPEMVGAYFDDLTQVLQNVHRGLSSSGSVWLVAGNSQYGECLIDVPRIVAELDEQVGFNTRRIDAFRSMRRSPQQGGRTELYESLVVLDRT